LKFYYKLIVLVWFLLSFNYNTSYLLLKNMFPSYIVCFSAYFDYRA